MSRINDNVVIGGAIFAIGLLALVGSFWIELDHDGGLGARAFPIMSACLLMLLGGLQFRPGLAAGSTGTRARSGNLRGPFLLLGLVVFYLWLISKIGYLFATGFAAPVALMLFGIRNPIGLILSEP